MGETPEQCHSRRYSSKWCQREYWGVGSWR